MLLTQILTALEEIAPLAAAETWDNVGLLTGDPQQEIHRILLTIDYTPAVAVEGRNLHCDLIIAYHPPIFSAVKRITADGPSSLIHDAIRRGVAIYSPHTAWDAAPGGANDALADALGLVNLAPLRTATPAARQFKLVTFVPEAHLTIVSDALFNAGAGHIGNYSHCSFRSAGTGTFLGGEGTAPTIGKPGQLETADEIRLETIVPTHRVGEVIAALRKSHPYEEPAFDLAVLAAPPASTGPGRIGHLPSPLPLGDLIAKVKKELNLKSLIVAGDPQRLISRAAVCAGAGGELLDDAIAARADLYLTGELRHHDAIKSARAGTALICTLHSNSERPSLTRLKSRLSQALPTLPEAMLSQSDQDPFQIH
jgi:dinuclear metal center YbgI/SA1388 family protein